MKIRVHSISGWAPLVLVNGDQELTHAEQEVSVEKVSSLEVMGVGAVATLVVSA